MNKVSEYFIGKNKIFVREYIPENKKFNNPLIFIHGAFESAFIWDKFINYFINKGFICYTFSLRGHKLSRKVNFEKVGLNEYVEDISCLVSNFNLENPFVIGHSMGGYLALMYGQNNETKGIIGLDPALTKNFWDEERKELVNEITPVVSMLDIGMHIKPENILTALPDVEVEELAQYSMGYSKESGKALKELIEDDFIDYEKIKNKSVLIIGANHDMLMPFSIPPKKLEEMAEYYKSDFISMEGVSHVGILFGDKYKNVAEKTYNWIKKYADKSSS